MRDWAEKAERFEDAFLSVIERETKKETLDARSLQELSLAADALLRLWNRPHDSKRELPR